MPKPLPSICHISNSFAHVHLSREYEVDPLEIIFAREVARTSVVVLPADSSPAAVAILLGPARIPATSSGSFPSSTARSASLV